MPGLILAQAPLRISFAGGGTDLPAALRILGEGRVVSATLAASVTVAVKPRFEGDVRLSYSRTEIVPDTSELQHALIRDCCAVCNVRAGVEIVTLADVPGRGTGLGSSGALAVATLLALYTYKRRPISAHELTSRASRIELTYGGGYQDVVAAAYGGCRTYTFLSEHTDTSRSDRISGVEVPVDLADLERHLLLVQVGSDRSAGAVLAQQQNAMAAGSYAPDLKHMVRQADDAATLLERADWQALGELVSEAWALKRRLPGVTSEAIERALRDGLRAGAWGGKLCGAGGGGFLLFVAPPDAHEAIRRAVTGRGIDKLVLSAKLTSEGGRVVYHG